MWDALNLIFGFIAFLGSSRIVATKRREAAATDDGKGRHGFSAVIMGVIGMLLGAGFIIAYGGALLGISQCEQLRDTIEPLFGNVFINQ